MKKKRFQALITQVTKRRRAIGTIRCSSNCAAGYC
jgi:hypothetical protein